MDAGICHGASGVAHMLRGFHAASDDPLFAGAASAWFRQTLDHRRPGPWFAGYYSAWPDRPRRRSDTSLLTGAAGVALALASAVSSDAVPAWDRMLLLDPLEVA